MSQARGQAWLRDRKLETDGEAITYTRGLVTISEYAGASLKAVPGRKPVKTVDQHGKTILVRSDKDFMLDPASLGVFGEPLEGDLIVYGGLTFEVWPTIVGEPCFRPCDDYDFMIRIHTRKVGDG